MVQQFHIWLLEINNNLIIQYGCGGDHIILPIAYSTFYVGFTCFSNTGSALINISHFCIYNKTLTDFYQNAGGMSSGKYWFTIGY